MLLSEYDVEIYFSLLSSGEKWFDAILTSAQVTNILVNVGKLLSE